MAGLTTNYGLTYFEFNDSLDTLLNVRKEKDRFSIIDSQLYGLYSIFGDGVISGWTVLDSTETGQALSISISSGKGISKGFAIESTVTTFLSGINYNSSINLYAVPDGVFDIERTVSFVLGNTLPSSGALLLATISTSSSGISSIDESVRDNVINYDSIFTMIYSHEHRGSFSKINLLTETSNSISGSKVDNLFVGKIYGGTFQTSQIPAIDHSELTGIGVLSHAEIDAALTTSTNSLSSIAIANLLKQIIFLKQNYASSDLTMINEITLVPGKTSLSSFDTVNSTATVDEDNGYIHCIDTTATIYYQFSREFLVPSNVKSIILTSDKDVYPGATVTFSINTDNSTTVADYVTVDENVIYNITDLFTTVGSSLRILATFGVMDSSPKFAGTKIYGIAAMIELEDGEKIQLNI
jgi:hypothetical protein